jgi:ubiquinone/menaquinone biosynthesis C-methylase UbiE
MRPRSKARRLLLAVGIVGGSAVALRRVPALATVSARRPSGPLGRFLYGLPTASHPAFQKILEMLALEPSDVLLDVGCGGGHFLALALARVERAAGLDHSPDMVALTARRNAAAIAAGRLEVREGDAAHLPWDDGHFTAVVMNQVFFWLTDPDWALAEAYRVLRPGGRLALLNAADRPAARLVALPYVLSGMHLYPDVELDAMLHRAGFPEVRVRSEGLVQYALARR